MGERGWVTRIPKISSHPCFLVMGSGVVDVGVGNVEGGVCMFRGVCLSSRSAILCAYFSDCPRLVIPACAALMAGGLASGIT